MKNIRVVYQGWSGCLLEAAAKPDLPLLAFDPAPGETLPDRPMIVLITHGHPEHIQGVVSHITAERHSGVSVLGSRSVCLYLERLSRNRKDEFFAVREGGEHELYGWRIGVFGWKHMSLLPPGWKAKGEYLGKLARHPLHLARIGLEGLTGPRHSPMLGFRAAADGAARLVYFGEGLHRKTSAACLRDALGDSPVEALLAAVEPEDSEVLPALIRSGLVRNFVAFEAHRIWREQFGLPQIDLAELEKRMDGVRMWTPSPGEALELREDA